MSIADVEGEQTVRQMKLQRHGGSRSELVRTMTLVVRL